MISVQYGENQMMTESVMMNKNRFSKLVEGTVKSFRMSYMDAVVYICEKNNIEIEDSKKYISNVVKEKIEAEAMRLNFLPRGNELPFE